MTEKEYFEGFRLWCRNPRVQIRIEGPSGVPLTLVRRANDLRSEAQKEARRERDDNLQFEEVWCVFDVDEHPHVREARELARANGLQLAMSNPCFDLWLLLHFRDHPGEQHRHHVQDMLATHMPGVKEKHIDFDLLVEGYEQATRRAERLMNDAIAAGEEGRNPSTEVFRLTDSINAEGCLKREAAGDQREQRSREKAEAAAQAAFAQAEREKRAADDDSEK